MIPRIGSYSITGQGGYQGTLTGTATLSKGVGNNRLLLGFCCPGEYGYSGIVDFSFNGVAMTLLYKMTEVIMTTGVFYLPDTQLPAAGTYGWSYTGGSGTSLIVGFLELYGVNQLVPINQYAHDDTNLSVNVISILDNLVVDVIHCYDAAGGGTIVTTPGAGQTKILDLQYSYWGYGAKQVSVSYKVATGTPTTMSWAIDHGDCHGHIGASIGGRPQIFGPRIQNN